MPVNIRVSPLGGFPPLTVTEYVFCTWSKAVAKIEVEDAVYALEVALNAPDTEKPSRVEPLFVKDSVNEEPPAIDMECGFPSAEKVLGDA